VLFLLTHHFPKSLPCELEVDFAGTETDGLNGPDLFGLRGRTPRCCHLFLPIHHVIELITQGMANVSAHIIGSYGGSNGQLMKTLRCKEMVASLAGRASLFPFVLLHHLPQGLVRELDVDFALAKTSRLNRPDLELPGGLELQLLFRSHISLPL
jgi:hypothetical protein